MRRGISLLLIPCLLLADPAVPQAFSGWPSRPASFAFSDQALLDPLTSYFGNRQATVEAYHAGRSFATMALPSLWPLWQPAARDALHRYGLWIVAGTAAVTGALWLRSLFRPIPSADSPFIVLGEKEALLVKLAAAGLEVPGGRLLPQSYLEGMLAMVEAVEEPQLRLGHTLRFRWWMQPVAVLSGVGGFYGARR